jgi:plasmid stability protein
MITQMTLRNIPDELEKRPRTKAKKEGHSINRATLALLEQALGIRPETGRKRDLSTFAGQWSPEDCRTFERNVKMFEKVDAEAWS